MQWTEKTIEDKKLMQAMKVIEIIATSLVRQVMTTDWVPWEDLYADGIVINTQYCILHRRICP